ncbi:hypothetical protein [Bacteroides sp. 224]|uniref:hypothetical protein n=1 Tax=Bacteroides sp. 224 TaxID=2302936 RepID=UPI0013D54C4F|nr:hypothetical protein [Bacteroides sp. 224]NDV63934.1 hypothetical protein [Bacteroides sp. 224]
MKEFAAQTGGRYTYVDDVLNLQNLALAFSSIFDGCDNFIVNGCKVSGTTISDGYIYINGKLRYFQGATGCTWPQYIYESNKTESVAYASGTDKVGRNIYGCAIGKSVPTVLDPLTGAIPQYISISASGGKQMKDALFGKYALVLDPSAGTQDVKGIVNFLNKVNSKGTIQTEDRAIVKSGNSVGQIFYEGTNLIIQSQISNGPVYKIALSNDNGFLFSINNNAIFSANGQLVSFKKPIASDSGKFGNIKNTGNNLYNDGVPTDSGSLYVNYLGYNGGNQYYRNTYIGNGKSGVILGIDGKTSLATLNGQLNISGSQAAGLILKSSFAKSNNSLQKIVSWVDSSSSQVAYIGYNSTTDKIFEIYNSLANISIKGLEAVNLGPVIMENGAKLSDKYALKNDVSLEFKKYAKADGVYSTTDADKRFAAINGGFSQFISTTVLKSTLRSQIDAVSMDDVIKKVPELSKLLSDMASTEDAKKKICSNIGATYGGDFQPKMKDSGWVKITSDLYVRQIGNIVSIQGYVTTIHSNTLFIIPNTIDPPTYAVAFSTVVSSYSGQWRCHIDANSRNCIVDYCNNHGVRIPFSITYMV